MKKLILIALAAFALSTTADAGLFKKKNKAQTEQRAGKKGKKGAQPQPQRPAPRKEVRPAAKPGLFNVQHYKDDWFFQIPDSLIGWPFLSTTRFISTPVELGVYGGELVSSHVLYWEKVNDRLMLRAMAYDATADSTDQIHRALVASTEDPIIAAFKLDSVGTKPCVTRFQAIVSEASRSV